MNLAIPVRLLKVWEHVSKALVSRRSAPSEITARATTRVDLVALCRTLLARREENAGAKLVTHILDTYSTLHDQDKSGFLNALADLFGPDMSRLGSAIAAFQASPDPSVFQELQAAVEPQRQRLIRLFNLAPQGIQKIVQMRADAIRLKAHIPNFSQLDADFSHILRSWFNRGFLVLKQVNWTSPARVLAKIIQYEAVHDIKGWDDLQSRIDPEDRRCFAFFHPQMPEEPLIFIEVALTIETPATIESILTRERKIVRRGDAKTAVFYSISNCNVGLRGIPFGNALIKQVVEVLKSDAPNLETFVTLSPVPGFSKWLSKRRAEAEGGAFSAGESKGIEPLDHEKWYLDPERSKAMQPALMRAMATYLLTAKDESRLPLDPVAKFHLGNGARLNRVNWLGDVSARGLRQSHGFMVNYLYDLKTVEENQEAIAVKGTIDASLAVRALLKH